MRYPLTLIRPVLTILLSLTLAACGENPTQTETERLNQWLDAQFEESLAFSPQTRSVLGEKIDNDKLNDPSQEAYDAELQWLRDSVATMRGEFDYDALSEDGKLSWEMWEYSLNQAEAVVPWRYHGYVYGRGGPQSGLPSFMISFHEVDTREDMEAYIARLRGFSYVLTTLLERVRTAAERGIRQPRFNYDFATDEIQRVTSGVPFNTSDDTPNSPIWTDVQGKIDGLLTANVISNQQAEAFRSEARDILSGPVQTAYQEVQAWLAADREQASTESQGVWALPDGDAYYAHRLQRMTTLDLTADEIHQIGLSEVARLRDEMETIKEQVQFNGTLQEFFTFLREDEQFYYPDTDQGRQEYLDINNQYLDTLFTRLPEFFGTLPKAPLEVRRVEAFREQPGAAQHYRQGSPDGSRPGVFYSHMSDMSTLAIFQIESIAYHEGNPGHHMQISIQQELTDVPRFRTQYRTTAYTEGWALYSEWLAQEMGGYEDPYSQFGRLASEMWRAIRLVVDTGIHTKRWSEQQAVQYFLNNSPVPEGAVRSEIQRYFATPGQATAYKVGMMNLQQARARAEATLGDAFDIRQFHDVVLGAGAVPMPLMHARVDRWIEETRQAN
ncbi:MAG: DUF885 domain-containing protein [Pseudohongiellaceae bacterium]